MIPEKIIPPPLLLNPLKHHLGYIRQFADNCMTEEITERSKQLIIREIKHIGGSVMDVYSGILSLKSICDQVIRFIKSEGIYPREQFLKWAGPYPDSFKTIFLTDRSEWVLKYYENESGYVHIFPARYCPHTFRVKANTLKSAILYTTFIGKDFITEEDLNTARAMAGLSPVKDVYDSAAISEMIEMIRG